MYSVGKQFHNLTVIPQLFISLSFRLICGQQRHQTAISARHTDVIIERHGSAATLVLWSEFSYLKTVPKACKYKELQISEFYGV